jgi:hypothetical protein
VKSFALFSLALLALPLTGHCDEPGSIVGKDKADRRSEPVSLGEGDYFLVLRSSGELFLEHQLRGKTSEWKVKPQQLESTDPSRQNKWRESQICEIALARWSRESLVAAVKTCDGPDATFWWLTFDKVESHARNSEMAPFAAFMSKGSRDDRILALSGTRSAITVTAVIGKLSTARPGAIESGVIVMHGCPNPGAIDGRIGTFTPAYSAEPYDNSEDQKK